MLTVVATPIGNLGDITLRAIESLKAADLVAAEDTRRTGLLLVHLGIKKPLISFHEHNEARRTEELLGRLQSGESVALVTDAGTPSISDPGQRLIRACAAAAIPMTVLPGASSAITALVGSGFRTDTFYFAGFLPVKSGGRDREVAAAGHRPETTIFFESPHRLCKTLESFARQFPGRRLCVARELTKIHEEYRRGAAVELLAHYTAKPPKGEICLVVEGAGEAGRP
jgi:16S rRNA (cytidine1402-2'-O)-methyltransferase